MTPAAAIPRVLPSPLPPLFASAAVRERDVRDIYERQTLVPRREGTPPPVSAAEAHARGGECLRRGDLEGAAEAFRVEARLTGSAYSYGLLGMTYARLGDHLRAAQSLEKAVRLQPADVDAYLSLGMVYMQTEKWPKAIRAYKKVTQLAPADATAYFYLGYVYAVTGQWEQAKGYYYAAIQRRRDYAAAYHYLARLCLDQGLGDEQERESLFNEAIGLYKELLEVHPQDYSALSNIGFLYRHLGNAEAALEYYRKSVEIGAENLLGLLNLAATYFDLRRFEQAAGIYNLLLLTLSSDDETQRPLVAEAYAGLGAARLEQYRAQPDGGKDPELLHEAETNLTLALQRDPGHFHAHMDLGVLYATTGLFREAEDEFRRALESAPGRGTALYSLRLVRVKSISAALRGTIERDRREGRLDAGRLAAEAASARDAAVTALPPEGEPGAFTPEDFFAAVTPAAEMLDDDEKYLFAARLYGQGLLGSDQAARLARADRVDFLLGLERAGVNVADFGAAVGESAAGTSPLDAEGTANLFLSDRLPDRYMAGEPRRDAEGGVWRVPVLLSYIGTGPLGEVGEIVVSADAGEVVSFTPLEEMKSRARGLYEQHRESIEAPVL